MPAASCAPPTRLPGACSAAQDGLHPAPFQLAAQTGLATPGELVQRTFAQQSAAGRPTSAWSIRASTPARLQVRTRLTASQDGLHESLCVMFLEDLREMEARVRTEKLAAMGRMSAAVAHEIRNPLAAISQANALLEEDLQDAGQRQL